MTSTPHAPTGGSAPGRGRRRSEPVYSISSTRGSAADEQRVRARRYLISMAIRTACFLLAVVVSGPLQWVCIAGAVLLPYVAVVLANAGRERRTGTVEAPGTPAAPQLGDGTAGRARLGDGPSR